MHIIFGLIGATLTGYGLLISSMIPTITESPLIRAESYSGSQTFGASIFTVRQGGTGTSTVTRGHLLAGAGIDAFVSVATTTASCAGTASCTAFTVLGTSPITITGSGGGSGTVSTSTNETAGRLSYWTSTAGTPALLGEVATTTLTASSPLSLSQSVVKVGGSNSVLSLDTSGTWTGNAGTASALAANGGNCSAGNFPLGVDASGAVETCTDAWTEAENTSAGYVQQTRTLTVAGTANQVTSSAGAQDLSANRTWTLSLPSHVIFPANFQVTNATTANATTTNLDITNLLTFNGVTGSTWAAFCTTITGGAGLCDGSDASGAGGSGSVATSTNEVATQVAVFTSNSGTPATIGGDTDFTFLTDRLTVTNASTSRFTALNEAKFGATATTTISSAGNILLPAAGTLTIPALTSALLLTDGNGLLAEYAGTSCTNQFPQIVSALGAWTCDSVVLTTDVSGTLPYGNGGTGTTTAPQGQLLYGGATAYQSVATSSATCTGASGVSCTTFSIVGSGGTTIALSSIPNSSLANSTISGISLGSNLANLSATDSTLTFSGTYTGATARTIGLNLGNANTWTALQTFGGLLSTASSTFTGGLSVFNATNTNATSTTLNVSGQIDFDTLTSALILTGSTGVLAEYAGASCTNQVVTSITAAGGATCTTLTSAYLDLTANYAWTGAHDFSGGVIEITNGASPTVDAIGEIALDTTANELLIATSTTAAAPGVMKMWQPIRFSYASSTQGSGTTTRSLGVAPAAGYLDEIQCDFSNFMRVMIYDGTNRLNDLVASSTIGTVKFTANNSFTSGEAMRVDLGTTTNIAANVYGGCTAKFYYTRN